MTEPTTTLTDELAWLMTSPAMLRPDIPGLPIMPEEHRQRLAAAAEPWLRRLESGGEEARRLSYRPPGERGGHRAEALMAAWLQHVPQVTLVADRLPVSAQGRTLGELDLVYDDEVRGCRVHCELAVKLHLQVGDSSAWQAWIGSDPRDSLARKLVHLRDHQLPLGRLAPMRDGRPCISEALVLGWLLQHPLATRRSPDGAAADHLRGWWIQHGQQLPQAARSSRFVVLPPGTWLAPARVSGDREVLAGGQLAALLDGHFTRTRNAVLVAEVRRDGAGDWCEAARGMVVHRGWPDEPGDGDAEDR
jgi:hypothetical protein